jgi:hypothetical protein
MSIEFYDVKLGEKVTVPLDRVVKITITQKDGQVRYAFRGLTEDGRPLIRFVEKPSWDAADVPHVSLPGKSGTPPPDDWSEDLGAGLPGETGTPPPDDDWSGDFPGLPGESGTLPPAGLSGKSGTFPSDS